MSVFLCPTNCADHDYMFPHSLVYHERLEEEGGTLYQITTEFIICRSCNHWIDGRYSACPCRFKCHEEDGGTVIVRTALEGV